MAFIKVQATVIILYHERVALLLHARKARTELAKYSGECERALHKIRFNADNKSRKCVSHSISKNSLLSFSFSLFLPLFIEHSNCFVFTGKIKIDLM